VSAPAEADRRSWVLVLAGAQLAVLVAGIAAALVSGFVGFAALAAAWMFLAVRISRYVLGDRSHDDEARQQVRRHLLGGADGPPPGVMAAREALEQHRRAMPALSGIFAGILAGGVDRKSVV
jgi:hypothetical protein